MKPKPILSLDFDGVLHSYASGWKGARRIPDPPTDGAVEFLLKALDHFTVAVFSSRSRYFGGRRAMKAWLARALEDWQWSQTGRVEQAFRYYGGGFTGMDLEEDYRRWAWSVIRQISFPLWNVAADR